MEHKKDYINRIFSLARAKGLCKFQGDFAELLGMNASTISGALKGNEKYLTDNFIRRVQAWAKQAGIEKEEERPQPSAPDIIIPAATANLYNNMSETIRIQAEIIARLQAGIPGGYAGVYAPKNSRLEK